MSTKAIRYLAQMFVEASDEEVSNAATAALREAEEIERAATWFASEDQDLEDAVLHMDTMRRIAQDAP